MKRMIIGLMILFLIIPLMAQTENIFNLTKDGQENALGAEAAVSPLIGIWKCSYKIGSKSYVDYITITSVSASGVVSGKDQYNIAVSGYTKNNIVFISHKMASPYVDGYYWGYSEVLFAKHLLVTAKGFSLLAPVTSKWHAMNQPKKVNAIPLDLPDRDFAVWLKSQSVLDEMWQETQNYDYSSDGQENTINAEATVSPLIGIWKCKYKVWSSVYIDYITITSVSSSGSVVGKDQNNVAVFGYTKNNMVFLIHKTKPGGVDGYFWGYNGIGFSKQFTTFPHRYNGSDVIECLWRTMYQPTKIAAIPLDLPDNDSVEWSKSQSVLDEIRQETQNIEFSGNRQENAFSTEAMDAASASLRPSSRSGAAMAYDSVRKKIVLFGGSGYIGTVLKDLGDTWVWDGETWTKASSTGPSARSDTAMDFDVPRKKMVLFGGVGSYQKKADTWSWNGLKWTKVASSGPEERFDHSMAYFGKHKKILLCFGWWASNTWEWTGTKWVKGINITTNTWDRAAMAYDKKRGRMVVFGGWTGGSDLRNTWEFNGNIWTKVSTTGPAKRNNARMAYDENLKKVILFGGFDWVGMVPTTYRDTWSWDGKTWKKLSTTGPSARSDFAMASDSVRKRIVLFGGSGGGKFLGDTWEWTGKAWIKVDPK